MRQNAQKGFLTIELAIASAIFALVVGGAMSVAFGAQTASLDVNLTNHALYHASTGLESQSASSTSILGWNTLVDQPAASSSDQFYWINPGVIDISPCAKLITNDITWTSENERDQSAGLETIVVNPEIAIALGGGCSTIPPGGTLGPLGGPPGGGGGGGGWDNPSSEDVSSVSGAKGTGIAVRSISGTKYAFITSNAYPSSQQDFHVINVDDPENPFLVTSLEVGPGLNGIAIGGTYAYVANHDQEVQLKVIDISNPLTLNAGDIVASIGLSDVNQSDPDLNAIGWSVAFYKERVYVGTKRQAGGPSMLYPEFHVFDVSSNPAAPSFMDYLKIDHNINAIQVREIGTMKYAFLATSDETGELMVVDVSENPLNLVHPDTSGFKFDAVKTDGTESDEDGWAIDVLNTTAYLGRAHVGNENERDFYILDVSDPANISELGSRRMTELGSGTRISGITTQWPLSFVSTTDTSDPLVILNVFDPANITVQNPSCALSLSDEARGVAYLDDIVFLANFTDPILNVIYDQPNSCTP